MLTRDELKERFVIVRLKGAEEYRIRDKESGEFIMSMLGLLIEPKSKKDALAVRDRRVEYAFRSQPDAWDEVE